MHWRVAGDYHSVSHCGYTICVCSGVYVAWAPGVKEALGYFREGSFESRDAAAVALCEDHFASKQAAKAAVGV